MSFQGLQWFGFNIDDITVKKVFLVKLIFRFILIKVKIYSCYGVNTPSLKCHLNKAPIHKFFLFCVQFKIPLQQLQSNGCAADPYSFNRSFTAPHSRYFLKNLGDFTGFYRTSLIVTPPPPPIVPRMRGEDFWVIWEARGKLFWVIWEGGDDFRKSSRKLLFYMDYILTNNFQKFFV